MTKSKDIIEMVEACAGIADWWTRPDFVRLHAGEMTAQEMRAAIAVAKGIAAMIRNETRPKVIPLTPRICSNNTEV